MKISVVGTCDAVVRWSLLAVVFLTPLFFLPLTIYAVSLNKQILVAVLVGIAGIAWLGKSLSAGEVSYSKNTGNGLVLGLVGAAIISALFSPARSIGFMGVNGGEIGTVIATITFILLFFLSADTWRGVHDVRRVCLTLIVSGLIVALYALLQMTGVWLFPWEFARAASFNTIGTTNALGLFIGCIFIFTFGAAYYDASWKKNMRIVFGIASGALFLMSIYIGYAPMFVGIAAALVVMVLADTKISLEARGARRNLIPIALIIISLFLMMVLSGVINITLPRAGVPPEVTPSISASGQIIKNSAQESIKNALIGSGPATYQYQYARYHDAALNQSYFWDVRFSQGFNALMTQAVEGGVLGTIIFILFLGVMARGILRVIKKRTSSPYLMIIAAGGAYLILALFIYPQNFMLYGLLFVIAGILIVQEGGEEARRAVVSIGAPSQKTFFWSVGMMLMIMGLASYIYVNAERYRGAVQFEKGIRAASRETSRSAGLPFFIAAQNRDPRNDLYLQVVGTVLLHRANEVAATSTAQTSAGAEEVRALLAGAIETTKRATEVNPMNAMNWAALARVYESVLPVVDGAAQSAFAAYTEARAREPHNSVFAVSEAQARIAYAETVPKETRAAEYALAKTSLQEALVLKPDYAPAHFALMGLLEREGDNEAAFAQAEKARAASPRDVGVLFDLGVWYFEKNQLETARTLFEAARELSPDYANVLYMLGVVYEREGKHTQALKVFEEVQILNPDNAEITTLIERLKKSKSGDSKKR